MSVFCLHLRSSCLYNNNNNNNYYYYSRRVGRLINLKEEREASTYEATVAGPLGEGRIAKKLLVCSRRCQCVRCLIVSVFCLESCLVPIAQAVEHWSCKPQVPGSIPGGDWHFFASHVLASLSSFQFVNLPTLPIYSSSLCTTSL